MNPSCYHWIGWKRQSSICPCSTRGDIPPKGCLSWTSCTRNTRSTQGSRCSKRKQERTRRSSQNQYLQTEPWRWNLIGLRRKNNLDIPQVKPWPNGLASQRKFAKPELAYGLAKGGQTDSQVGSQVAKSRTFHAYNWYQLVSTCAGWPNGKKNLRLLASKFELDQVNASRHKWVAKRNASWTQVQNLRVRLARAWDTNYDPLCTERLSYGTASKQELEKK